MLFDQGTHVALSKIVKFISVIKLWLLFLVRLIPARLKLKVNIRILFYRFE